MNSDPTEQAPSVTRDARWIAALGALSVALLGVCLYLGQLVSQGGSGKLDSAERDRLLAELSSQAKMVFDSHPDPDVGRVLLSRLKGLEFSGVPIHTNRQGMRERDYALPKPADTVRVVILGDSFVFGFGVNAEDRVGVFLERWLNQRASSFNGLIEVLHIAVGSWGVIEECEFVRRQLSELAPDLVLQLLVTNDLDDGSGVRGQGIRSNFSPRERQRADSMVFQTFPDRFSERGGLSTYLLFAVDAESRERYEIAVEHMSRLNRAVERCGGKYVALPLWAHFKPRIMPFIRDALPESSLAFPPDSYYSDREFWNSPRDLHWNREGHARFARFLYGLIRERGLLPQLGLEAWPEADEQYALDASIGRGEALQAPPGPNRLPLPVSPLLDFRAMTPQLLAQVYGGVTAEGITSPYASMLLSNFPGGKLAMLGRCLDRPELDGALVRVFAEEHELGSMTLTAGSLLRHEWELPEALEERGWINVRFESEDWVYSGDSLRECVCFQIHMVGVRPPE